jgi:hypothetical protein
MYDTAVKQTKRPYNLPTYFIARPSKIYQNWYICLKINHLATLAAMRCMHFRKVVPVQKGCLLSSSSSAESVKSCLAKTSAAGCSNSDWLAGLPDYSWNNIPKTVKMY